MRTQQNVIDSDGTLILYRGQYGGGTEITDRMTAKHGRPCLRVDLDAMPDPKEVRRWLQAEGIALAEDGFVPPPLPIEVLLLQRKFGGVFLLASRLGARVDVVGLLRPYLVEI